MKMFSKLILVFGVLLTQHAYAENQDCGMVKIDSFLTGLRHGTMMRVSNPACGNAGGWICLDPGAQYMTPEVSKRVYAQALAFHMADKEIRLSVLNGTYATTCNGPYAVLEDMRTN